MSRAFYGIPDLTNAEGLHTNAVYGFLNILFKVLDEEKADSLAVAFDLKAPTFRHKMYDAYKGTRKPMPAELHEQVPVMKEVLSAMGVPILTKEGYEADDILGTIAFQAERMGMEVSILSGDRDLLQLATDRIQIRHTENQADRDGSGGLLRRDVLEKYQVTPTQFIDVKALMGDASDNIPGIPGVGEKTATKIIVQFGSIENAHEHLEEITPKKPGNPCVITMIWQCSPKSWRRSIREVRWILTRRRRKSKTCIQKKHSVCFESWSLRTCSRDLNTKKRAARPWRCVPWGIRRRPRFLKRRHGNNLRAFSGLRKKDRPWVSLWHLGTRRFTGFPPRTGSRPASFVTGSPGFWNRGNAWELWI